MVLRQPFDIALNRDEVARRAKSHVRGVGVSLQRLDRGELAMVQPWSRLTTCASHSGTSGNSTRQPPLSDIVKTAM